MQTKSMINTKGQWVEVDINTPCKYINDICMELDEEDLKEIEEKEVESLLRETRVIRDPLITETDYLMTGDHPKVDDVLRLNELKAYRKALRDITKQITNSKSVVTWPTKPEWI